jgi:hypothetical protein
MLQLSGSAWLEVKRNCAMAVVCCFVLLDCAVFAMCLWSHAVTIFCNLKTLVLLDSVGQTLYVCYCRNLAVLTRC